MKVFKVLATFLVLFPCGNTISQYVLPTGETVSSVLQLNPQNFSLEGLAFSTTSGNTTVSTFFLNGDNDDEQRPNQPDFTNYDDAASQLCLSAYGLDIPALKYLLYDLGVPADLKSRENGYRNALHCLALIYTMVDPHPRSQIFAHLMGTESWLAPHLDPPLPLELSSVLTRDIMDSLENSILSTAQWLHRAGVPANDKDLTGHTPLHLATLGGERLFVQLLLEMGSDPNARNQDERTPLHLAAAYGHAEIASMLVASGGNLHLKDRFSVSPYDIIANPGAISAEDAKRYFGIEQRRALTIERVLHPERYVNDSLRGWAAGTGGWGDDRLSGFELDMECAGIDQYRASEISGDEVFEKYIARNAPVLIRGLIDDWDAMFEYEYDILRTEHGHVPVQASEIPYADKFGGAPAQDMDLGEYIDSMVARRSETAVDGRHPRYVFWAHTIPSVSEKVDSLVRYDLCPTPDVIDKAFARMPGNERYSTSTTGGEKNSGEKGDDKNSGVTRRNMFVTAQWALGGPGTGAPVHFHNTAWNALIYGAKKWFIYPPHNMIMSNKQILEYTETDMLDFSSRNGGGDGDADGDGDRSDGSSVGGGDGDGGSEDKTSTKRRGTRSKEAVVPLTCVQTARDVIILPESWGHGVLNLQESVAVASESRHSFYRATPQTRLFSKFPEF